LFTHVILTQGMTCPCDHDVARCGFKTDEPSIANKRSSWPSLWHRRRRRVTVWCAPCTSITTPGEPIRTRPATPWRLAMLRISSWTPQLRQLLPDTRSSRPGCPARCRACTAVPAATWPAWRGRQRRTVSSRLNDSRWLPTTDWVWLVSDVGLWCLSSLVAHLFHYTVYRIKTHQLREIVRIDFDDIWHNYSKDSRIEFACFCFHVGCFFYQLSSFKPDTENSANFDAVSSKRVNFDEAGAIFKTYT